MPIANGRRGLPGALAIPGDRFLRSRTFRSRPFSTSNTTIFGVTKDSIGAVLAGCVVKLMCSGGDLFRAQTVSDGSGNYLFDNPGSGPFYILAYKAGTPDVAGTTVNTLIAS